MHSQQIKSLLNHNNKQQPYLVPWLLRSAKSHGASELHIDWINGCCIISLRVDGCLQCIVDGLSFNEGDKLLRLIKKELRIGAERLKAPWSGRFVGEAVNDEQENEIYIIPFSHIDSVKIRLQPQTKAVPTWTDKAGIAKKIFIWQMGKVGSSTILASLKPYSRQCLWPPGKISDEPFWQYNNIIHSHSAKPIYHVMHHSDEEFIIISLVRDILQRNISAVFQSMCDETTGNQCFIAPENELRRWENKRIYNAIKNKLRLLNLSDRLTAWYDALFKSHFYYPDVDRYHIDVYSKPFDHRLGMQVYESKTPRIKLLIARLENLNDIAGGIGNFLNIDGFNLHLSNIGESKWYKEIYKEFRRIYKPSQEELDHIYNSRFMNYFYGDRTQF